jgi:hypothetical protein
MIRVIANQGTQQLVYVTPFNNRKDLAGAVTHYLFEIEQTNVKKYFIANVGADNERYTEVRIVTNADAPTSGSILLTSTGMYTYTIYGQSSSTNLDPANAAVQGVLETGSLQVVSSDSVATQPTFTVPGYIYYRE